MNYQESINAFEKLFSNQMGEDEAKTLLVDLYNRGENYEEIAAAASVMREHSIKLVMEESLQNELIDIVGTGGDKSGSFNISSTTALLLSSMEIKVAKHGNRSITSKSGSADMLEALGINLNHDPSTQVKMLEEVGFTFIFAINHHPAMKYIMPIRKSLDHRTIFNILGPLTNPAGVKKLSMGVFDHQFNSILAKALKELGATSAIVASSKDGLDEVSISDVTYISRLIEGEISEEVIDPTRYGFELAPLDAIKGGNGEANAKITYALLNNEIDGAKRDILLLNSAVALVVEGRARDIQEGIAMAQDAIESGASANHLKKIIEVSNRLS
jgi:anthranilate phosphoribosyltransferase